MSVCVSNISMSVFPFRNFFPFQCHCFGAWFDYLLFGRWVQLNCLFKEVTSLSVSAVRVVVMLRVLSVDYSSLGLKQRSQALRPPCPDKLPHHDNLRGFLRVSIFFSFSNSKFMKFAFFCQTCVSAL